MDRKETVKTLLREKANELRLDEHLAGLAFGIYEKHEDRFKDVDIQLIPEMLSETLGAISYLMEGRSLDLAVKVGAIDMLKSKKPWTLPELVESLQLSLIVYELAKEVFESEKVEV